MSLLEVLAAIGVLSIGLLGLAALLPIGRYTIGEATKADRAGQCGRAALRDVIVRRMLDPYQLEPMVKRMPMATRNTDSMSYPSSTRTGSRHSSSIPAGNDSAYGHLRRRGAADLAGNLARPAHQRTVLLPALADRSSSPPTT